MKVHFFMISLRPFRHSQVSNKFFRRLRTSGDLTLQKKLVLFLHQPHLKEWQRVHHSASSIRERWHWSLSTSFHIRGVRVSIWISREILQGLMNIMIRRIMLIFIALGSSLRNRVVSTMMFIWGLWSFWGKIHMRNLVRMRTLIQMKNLVHMKNFIWGSYSLQVVSWGHSLEDFQGTF